MQTNTKRQKLRLFHLSLAVQPHTTKPLLASLLRQPHPLLCKASGKPYIVFFLTKKGYARLPLLQALGLIQLNFLFFIHFHLPLVIALDSFPIREVIVFHLKLNILSQLLVRNVE